MSEAPSSRNLAVDPTAFTRLGDEGRFRAVTRHDFWLPTIAYLVSRVLVVVVAKMSTWLAPTLRVEQMLAGWDGGWYLAIADNGYPGTVAIEGGGNRWAFFPGLPASVKLIAATGISHRTAGLILGVVAGLVAVLGVWKAVEAVAGTEFADRVAVLLCFFPTAYVFSMVYTEGMFLAGAAWCLYWLRREAWIAAGLAACFAATTRNSGAVVILCCLAVAAPAAFRARTIRPLSAVVIPSCALAGWLMYQWNRVGSPTAFLEAQSTWGHEWNWFSTPIRSTWRVVVDGGWERATEVVGMAALFFVVVGAVGLLRFAREQSVPLAWWVYSIGMVVAAFSPFWPSSMLRYTMVIFPLMVGVASLVPARWHHVLVASMAVGQGALAMVAFAGIEHWQTAPLAP